MANFRNVMEVVFRAEHSSTSTYLHFNKHESTYTYMGVYPYTKLKSSYLIDKAIEEFRDIRKASRALSKSEALTDEVLEFYFDKFWLPMGLDKVESDLKCKEIMVFVINVGLGRKKSIVKAIQRIVGTKVDGIFGKNTLKALNNFDDEVFSAKWDEHEIKFYRRLVRKYPRLTWALRGWENRSRIV
ncbi:hypothetical protein PF327_10700 [Sulfurovum sp. XTW-4]|uniref:Peptidoglycan binding domain-containing protein n=1 Tax=Sulfurovum xiamenensis TaxID=3019066 RepID=A0ABT7QUA9_9BACT|nr:putative peptidoglycan-binding domain-containing protein [Sulfurovum xiamenensis]MDM5264663.1 hypothetical protein [Sulfurovum xiamenensis]